MAILRFVGRKYGFYPTDPVDQLRCDEITDTYSDNFTKLYSAQFAQGEEREAKIKLLFGEHLPKFLEHYDKHFAESKHQFLFGDKPVTADFLVAGTYINFINNPNVGFEKEQWEASVANFPHYKAYGERLSALLGSYLTSRPPAPI